MRTAVVNAEYQLELFRDITGGPSTSEILRARMERQFLFYFINQDPDLKLADHVGVSPEVLDYYGRMGISLPALVPPGKGENWYGKFSHLETERRLNSKLFCYEFLEKLGDRHPEATVVSSSDEVRLFLKGKEGAWVLKSPYLHSGKGHRLIRSTADIPPSLDYPHLLEPWYERIHDLSTHFDPVSGEMFSYRSRMNPGGGYFGGWVDSSPASTAEFFQEKAESSLFYEFRKKSEQYIHELRKLGLTQPVTLDGFIYRQGDVVRLYPLCEINYRKSMGTLNRALRRFLPEGGAGLFLCLPPGRVKWTEFIPYSPERREGILALSPGSPFFEPVLLSAKDRRSLRHFEVLVFQTLST